MSQAQAARELDVARTAYRLWELEAAKPAPDRWRLVARWLGVSMTTLFLAEGLINEDEAADVGAADSRYGPESGETADAAAEREGGSFFDQADSFLDVSLERGIITANEAGQFRTMFRRIQRGLAAGGTPADR
jgi:DNA-binding XRE family transcriptional regulator